MTDLPPDMVQGGTMRTATFVVSVLLGSDVEFMYRLRTQTQQILSESKWGVGLGTYSGPMIRSLSFRRHLTTWDGLALTLGFRHLRE